MDIKNYGSLKIYYKDKDSVYFELQRKDKMTRKYILTRKAIKTEDTLYGFADALYKDTKSDIFNKQ
jgi:hypothetical protein